MSIDPELVRRKAALILEDLARLGPLAALDNDQYHRDPLRAVEAYLERSGS